MEKRECVWYSNDIMKKWKNYFKAIWEVLSPLFIYWGTTVAVLSAGGILSMMLGNVLPAVAAHPYDVVMILSGIAAAWAAYLLWKIEKREMTWYSQPYGHFPGRGVLLCMGAAVGISIGGNCLLSLTGISGLPGYGQARETVESASRLLTFLNVCIAAPVAEEMIFRVVVYRRLRRRICVRDAVLVSSLFFAVYHMNLPQACFGFLTGIVLALFMEAYDNPMAPVLVHMMLNSCSVILSWSRAGELLGKSRVAQAAALLVFGGVLAVSLVPVFRKMKEKWKEKGNETIVHSDSML